MSKHRIETTLAHAGRHPEKNAGVVNPPVCHASTILFKTYADFSLAREGKFPGSAYGRHGTETMRSLEEAIMALEGADKSFIFPSGLSAIVVCLFSFLRAGDHLLIADSVYDPTRRFADQELASHGVEVTYYDPVIGPGIAELIRSNTKVVYTESPGSLTFEVQDLPALAKAAHEKGAVVIIDNSWATPLFYRPLSAGADIVIHSATKYIGGHSDLMMGIASCRKEHAATITRTYKNFGISASPDDCYLAQRGLRTLAARLKAHRENALFLADRLEKHPKVAAILHPAFASCPGHELWKRDFTGSSGLFSVVLKAPYPDGKLSAMLDNMELFGMGYSWGGYESLIIPFGLEKIRTSSSFPHKGALFRIHAGLENKEDLWEDLEKGLERLG